MPHLAPVFSSVFNMALALCVVPSPFLKYPALTSIVMKLLTRSPSFYISLHHYLPPGHHKGELCVPHAYRLQFFDTITPHRLLTKLRDLGLSSSLCTWIQSFLTEHRWGRLETDRDPAPIVFRPSTSVPFRAASRVCCSTHLTPTTMPQSTHP